MVKVFILMVAVLIGTMGAAGFEVAGEKEKEGEQAIYRLVGLFFLLISASGFYIAGGLQ